MEVEFNVITEREMGVEERHSLRHWLRQVFGASMDELVWADVEWRVLAMWQGECISHVELLVRAIRVGDKPLTIGGVGGVATRPEWRRQGLAGAVLARAAEFLRHDLGLEFALLICGEELVAFYQSLGWQVVDAPTFFDQPDGRRRLDGVTMIISLGGNEWPSGEIDLCGLPW